MNLILCLVLLLRPVEVKERKLFQVRPDLRFYPCPFDTIYC